MINLANEGKIKAIF